jgi:cytosine deaminase
MDIVHVGIHMIQTMGHSEIMQSYRHVTWEAAHCLNIVDDYGIRKGLPANFIILNAKNWFDALNRRSEVLLSVRRGKTVARSTPRQEECLF